MSSIKAKINNLKFFYKKIYNNNQGKDGGSQLNKVKETKF